MNAAEQNKTLPEDLLCKDCVLEQLGAGKDVCEKHGKAQIDWKCMYCCDVAVYHCFGTHYMCNRCHTGYGGNGPEPRDCHGVNCPLGIAHPPASKNHKEANFCLGCGICRSERKSLFKSTAIKQIITAQNAPKAFGNANDAIVGRRMKGVIYPDMEVDVPEFISQAATIDQEFDLVKH